MKGILDWLGESPARTILGLLIFVIGTYYSYGLLMILFGTLWAMVKLLFWPVVLLGGGFLIYNRLKNQNKNTV